MYMREMENNHMKNRVFAFLMTALMLVTLLPAAALAAGDSYTLVYNNGDPNATADYDPASPTMLPTPAKVGFTFAGWYTEDPSGAYVEETTTETKYYSSTSTEKSTTSPDFTSGKEYYTKVETYTPMISGTNFRRQKLDAGVTAPDGAYIIPYGTGISRKQLSKYADNETVYLDTYTYYQAYRGRSAALDALLPSGYTGADIGAYVPFALTAEIKTALAGIETYALPVIGSDFTNYMSTTSNRNVFYALYEKSSTKTPVTASTYTSGTVYYMDTVKTEIPESDYEATNPAHSTETVTTPTGRFIPKTGSEPAGTKLYTVATMTPAASKGAVTYRAVWTAEPGVSTYTLNYNNGTAPVTAAYDPASPVTLPTPGRTGYAFVGWVDEDGNAVTKTPSTEGDVTFTAMWEYSQYITDVTFQKSYDRTFETAAQNIATQDVFTETVSYTITAVGSENRAVGKTAIPVITPEGITVGDGSDSVTITLPDFNAADYGIGDYWYRVEETAGTTAGVAYDTTTYYLHLVVTDEDGTGGEHVGVRYCVIHKTVAAGGANAVLVPGTTDVYVDLNDASTKVLGFTNTYNAGELAVTKQVTGNMGDPDKLFKVTVTFTAPTGTTVMSPISYTGGFADEAGATALTEAAPGTIAPNWSATATAVVYLKDDATVTFTNIPEGVTYTVVEDDYSDDGYEAPVYEQTDPDTDDAADDAGAAGSISDAKDAVTITNKKDVAVDVGVTLEDMPFVMIVAACTTALLLVILKRRKHAAD